MSKVYVHYGEREFDKKKFNEIQQKNAGQFLCCDKRPFDLWGSQFNKLGTLNWERLIGPDFIHDIKSDVISTMNKEKAKLINFLDRLGVCEQEFYEKSSEDQDIILSLYQKAGNKKPSQSTLRDWELNYDFAKLEIYEKMKLSCQKHRENAFFFIVDQSKILHVNEVKDIEPYLASTNIHTMDIKNRIRFDKLQGDGYGGLELQHGENYINLHFGSVFRTWDVDSISIWDPDCVTVISPEIAHISRLAADVHLETSEAVLLFDKYDLLMNVDIIINWIQEHQSEVQQAIDDGIITIDDVAELINQKYDSSGGKQQGQDPMDFEQDYEEIETCDVAQQYDVEIERSDI